MLVRLKMESENDSSEKIFDRFLQETDPDAQVEKEDEIAPIANVTTDETKLFNDSDLRFEFVQDYVPGPEITSEPKIDEIFDKKWQPIIWPQLKNKPSLQNPILLDIGTDFTLFFKAL